VAGGGAPSLDQVTGSAAQATATETGTGHEWTYAGVETASGTYPIVIQNTNSTNNSSSGALIVNTVGTSTGQIPLVVNETSASGNLIYLVNGGTVTNGVLSGGTGEFFVNAVGNTTVNGSLQVNSTATVGTPLTVGTTVGIFTSANGGATYKCTGTNCGTTVQASGTGTILIPVQGATAVGLTIKGASSQSGDLQDWENNTPTVLSGILSSGNLSTPGIVNFTNSAHLLYSGTAPTIGTCGTGPSIPNNNGTAAFTVNVGTGGTATTCTVNMPAATTGWACFVAPNGAPQAAAEVFSAPTSTTLITLSNYTASTGVALAFTASEVLQVSCHAY